MLRRWKRWRAAKDGRQHVITTCCECGVDMKRTGDELFVACHGCGTIIGHLTMREVALIALRFEDRLNCLLQQRGIERVFEAEREQMLDDYIALLHKWSAQAVEDVLAAYVPIEGG